MEIQLKLTDKETKLVLDLLIEYPYDEISEIVSKISNQAHIQVKKEYNLKNKEKVSMEERKKDIMLLHEAFRTTQKELKAKKDEWIYESEYFMKECSHKYSNGKSAWEHGYIMSICQLCGVTDE